MMIITALVIQTIVDGGMSFVSNFSTLDYFIGGSIGLCSASLQVTGFLAAKHEEPAKIASVNYFQAVFQLLFDVVFFGTQFSTQQMVGMSVVFSVMVGRWLIGMRSMLITKQ